MYIIMVYVNEPNNFMVIYLIMSIGGVNKWNQIISLNVQIVEGKVRVRLVINIPMI